MKPKLSVWLLCASLTALSLCAAAVAEESLADQVNALEPLIGSFPPQIKGDEQVKSAKDRYAKLKAALDAALAASPADEELLFSRGHLQAMGHNLDIQGAWEGSTDDLGRLIKADPKNIAALTEIASLWVNSRPELSGRAETLFRAAQCAAGGAPLEPAQRGIFFSLYYQAKFQDALHQADYLAKTWPEQNAYRTMQETTRGALRRSKSGSYADEAPDAKHSPQCPAAPAVLSALVLPKQQTLDLPFTLLNPNPALWHEADRRSDPMGRRGMVTLKRDALKDTDGRDFQPVLSVVFEALPPGVHNAEEFAAVAQQRGHIADTCKRSDQDASLYQCRYNNGLDHSLTIVYRVTKDVAIQLLADSTFGVRAAVQADFDAFLHQPTAGH